MTTMVMSAVQHNNYTADTMQYPIRITIYQTSSSVHSVVGVTACVQLARTCQRAGHDACLSPQNIHFLV